MTDRTVRVRLEAVTSMYTAKLTQAAAATKAFGATSEKATGQARKGFDALGIGLLGFGAAVVGGLGIAAKAAMDFESSFAGVRKTVDASEGQFDQMAKELRALAPELGVNVNELNRIAEEAGQLGIARPNIVGFTETVAKLRETTNLVDAAPLARLMNIMQTAESDVGNLGAALVDLGNNGASTESEILEMSQRIAGAGNIIGITEADVLGFANALASVGIRAEAGGSSISRVMLDIDEAVMTGGESLEKFAEVAGMSSEAFSAAYEQDAAGAIVTFVEGLGRIEATGGNVAKTLRDLGFSEIRVRQALLGLAGAGDLTRESLELGNKAMEEGTALNDEFAKRMDTTAKKLDQAKAQVGEFAITIGENLLPALGFVADAVGLAFGAMADAIGALPDPLQAAAAGLTGLVGVVSLLGGALLIAAPRIAATKVALAELGVASKLSALSAGGFIRSLGLIGVAFVALPPVIEAVTKGVEDFIDQMQSEGLAAALTNLERMGQGGIFDPKVNPRTKEGWDDFLVTIEDTGAAMERSIGPSKSFQEAVQGTPGLFDSVNESVGGATDALAAHNKEMREARNLAMQMAGGFLGLWASVTAVRDAEEELVSAQRRVNRLQNQGKEGTKQYKNAQDDLTDAQVAAITENINATEAIAEYAKELAKSGTDQEKVNDMIREFGKRAGLTREEVNDLIDSVAKHTKGLKDVPGHVDTRVTADTGPASAAVDALLNKYRGMHVAVIVEGRVQGTGTVRHSGGWIPGAGEVPITAMAGEYIVRKDRSSKYADVLEAMNSGSEDDVWHRLAGKMHNGGRVEPRIILELGDLNSALHDAATTPVLGGNLVQVANSLIGMGFRAAGHPAFPPIGTHSPGSYHYQGRAVDFNYGPAGASSIERAAIAGVLPMLEKLPHVELLHPFNDPEHDDHLHYAMHNGGIPQRDGMAMLQRNEVVSPMPMMRQAVQQESISPVALRDAVLQALHSWGPAITRAGECFVDMDRFAQDVVTKVERRRTLTTGRRWMTTLRFEDASAVLRLDLEGGISQVMADFNLGDEDAEFATLTQGGVGQIQVAVTPVITEMFVPLYLTGTWSQIKAFHASLVTELHRETNILRFVPPNQSDAYLIDTFHSRAPTLFRPSDLVSASASGQVRLEFIIRRASQLRGAAVYI